MRPEFVPALELNAGFYHDVVEPAVRTWPHAAALLGYGSELLGFDTERSTDHGWGPRLQVFVDAACVPRARAAVERALPEEYRGWPVRFGWDEVPVTHHVEVLTVDAWLRDRLSCNPLAGMSVIDWLVAPQQRLLGVVRGAVYRDDIGDLTEARSRLEYFPDALVPWLLACQWRRVWQTEALAGRAAEVGDETGSRLVVSRIVRDLIRLHFLLEREYWPYDKWLGSAYRRLPGTARVLPALDAALGAPDHAGREDALVEAYEALARLHNANGLTEPVDPTIRFFHTRPYRVLGCDRFVQACLRRVDDAALRRLPLVGSIDQFVDSTDILERPGAARMLRTLYGG